MAEANLDAVIRQTAKQQNKTLMTAVKAGRDRYLALAAKAKDTVGKERFKRLAADAMEQGTAAARRLQMSADNAADSYARAMRMAAEAFAAKAEADAAKSAPVTKKAASEPAETPNKVAKAKKAVKTKKAVKAKKTAAKKKS